MIDVELLRNSENYPCTSCGETIDVAQLKIARASLLTQQKYAKHLAAGNVTLRLCAECAREAFEKIATATAELYMREGNE